MTDIQNRQVRLAARPVGLPKRADWELTTEPVPEPGEGEALVKVLCLSLDPAMRGWMNEGKSYIEPVAIGAVMRALGVGQVISSRDPSLAVGDFVSGLTGVQEYAVLKASHLTEVDPRLAPLPVHLNVLGMPGMTAYFGLFAIGEPKAGETVVVSGAAGAVGATVGQLAKITGCRVVGIAGGRDKCKYIVDELGFDAAIDYKSEDVAKRLQDHCPNRIDVYFDNVGGDILDACLAHLAMKGRIVVCGAISQYNNTTPIKGPSNYLSLLINRGRMEGMVVMDYAGRFGHAVRDMAKWMAEGKLKSREDVAEGLETFPETLLKLFSGENFGKLVLRVA
jgi:NADPH-dependent curcumin reductase CurA